MRRAPPICAGSHSCGGREWRQRERIQPSGAPPPSRSFSSFAVLCCIRECEGVSTRPHGAGALNPQWARALPAVRCTIRFAPVSVIRVPTALQACAGLRSAARLSSCPQYLDYTPLARRRLRTTVLAILVARRSRAFAFTARSCVSCCSVSHEPKCAFGRAAQPEVRAESIVVSCCSSDSRTATTRRGFPGWPTRSSDCGSLRTPRTR